MANEADHDADLPSPQVNIHAICSEYERRLQGGEAVSLSTCLMQCQPEDRAKAFNWLFAITVRQIRDTGGVVEVDNYLQSFPEYSDEIQRIVGYQRKQTASMDETKTFIANTIDPSVDTNFGPTLSRSSANASTRIGPTPEDAQSERREAPAESLDFKYVTEGGSQLEKFAQYTVLSHLGRGGMGDVLLAEDCLLGRKVALKLMRSELSERSNFKERFFREARAMAALDHPNIVPIYQIGEEQGIPFLCMPYIEGVNLARYLDEVIELSQLQVLDLMRQVAEGLAAIHGAGLVHRDIKPSNIVVSSDPANSTQDSIGHVRILDFGLVRFEDDDHSLTGTQDILGTLNYLAPEQAKRGKVDARSDLFSLGIVAYEAATGTHPFARSTGVMTLQAIVSAVPRAPRFLNDEISPLLSDLILQLLAKDPNQRNDSAVTLVNQIDKIQTRLRNVPRRSDSSVSKKAVVFSTDENVDALRPSSSDSRFWEVNPVLAMAGIGVIGVAIITGFLLFQLMSGGNWSKTPQLEVFQPRTLYDPDPAGLNRTVNNLSGTTSESALKPTNNSPSTVAEVSNTATKNLTKTVVNNFSSPETTSSQTTAEETSRETSPSEESGVKSESRQQNSAIPGVLGSTKETQPKKRGESEESFLAVRRADEAVSIKANDKSFVDEADPRDLITPTPALIEDAQLAAEGRLLILHLKGEPSLTVYDVEAGKLVRTLLLPTSEFLYAAGGSSVLVYLKEFQELETWNLQTFERERSREFRDIGIVLQLAMNPNDGNLAIVHLKENGTNWNSFKTLLLQLDDLDFLKRGGETVVVPTRNTFSMSSTVDLRVNSDASLITEWSNSVSPTGVNIYIRQPDGIYDLFDSHETQLFLVPSDNGYVHTGLGKIYSIELIESQKSINYNIPVLAMVENTPLIPVIDGDFALGLQKDGSMNVYHQTRSIPICGAGRFPGWPDEIGESDEQQRRYPAQYWIDKNKTFNLDHRLWGILKSKTLLMIPTTNDRIVKRPLDLQELLEETGKKFLVVTSQTPKFVTGGQHWTYQLTTASDSEPVSFTLVEGPKSMALSDAGALTWETPDGISGRVPVSIRLQNASDRQMLFRFVLELSPQPSDGQKMINLFENIEQAIDESVQYLKSRSSQTGR